MKLTLHATLMKENHRKARWWKRPVTPVEAGVTLAVLLAAIAGISGGWYIWTTPSGGSGAPNPQISTAAAVADFSFSEEECLIPLEEIRSGGPRKDGIPALTDPEVVDGDDADWLNPDDRVIGVVFDGEARAYPLRILNYHEAVNDTVGNQLLAATYCPLCDSALVFDRVVGGEEREFGISGLLYNSNVLLYDRQQRSSQESLWSQMMLKAVCGPAAQEGLELELLPSELAVWEDWLEGYPETTVLSQRTEYPRSYHQNPYGRYFSNNELMFPVEMDNLSLEDLPRKEETVIVEVNGDLKGYPFSRLQQAAGDDQVYEDNVGGQEIRLEITNTAKQTVRVSPGNSSGEEPKVAYSFWFIFRAMHPDAEYLGSR